MSYLREKAGRIVLLNLAFGCVPALVELLFGHPTLKDLWQDSITGTLYSSCVSVPCLMVMPRIEKRMTGRPLRIRLTAALASLLIASFGGCIVAGVILVATGIIPLRAFWSSYWSSLRLCLAITYTLGLASYGISVLEGRLEAAESELQARKLAEERAKKMEAEARFASLESRVRPHFLFNTLNSISALVRESPEEAERMIERLAHLLRYSLDSEQRDTVPLGEELRIVREYLAIEQVRFGDRLRYRIDAAENTFAQMVPVLSVQTLVENSVKYAVCSRPEGARIVVSAGIEGGRLRVEVHDDGPGFEPAAALTPGHGLDLLQRRLESLKGRAAQLEMQGAPGDTFVAILVNA